MAEKYFPTGERFLIAEEQVEATTPGGIALPDIAQKQTGRLRRGRVIAKGPEVALAFSGEGAPDGVCIMSGDHVLFDAGYVVDEERGYQIVHQDAILAVVRGGE